MGDSSAGPVSLGQRGGGGITPKGARICEAAHCQNPVPSGSGNYRYCFTQCKNSLKKEKRKSTVGQSTPKRQIAGAVMSPILFKFGQCI